MVAKSTRRAMEVKTRTAAGSGSPGMLDGLPASGRTARQAGLRTLPGVWMILVCRQIRAFREPRPFRLPPLGQTFDLISTAADRLQRLLVVLGLFMIY